MTQGHTLFPLWIEFSGLPLHLAGKCKTPLAWLLFKKIAEIDTRLNRLPGTIEVTLQDLGSQTGMTPDQVLRTLKKLRKTGVLRSFLPDNEEEPGIFQIVTPLPTPIPWEQVREAQPPLANLPDHAFRYAVSNDEHPQPADPQQYDPKLREVVDLYLNNVSMKMNALILDELRLISSRYDLPLIRRVFARARQKEVQSLAWILREVRRETKLRQEIQKKKVQA